MDISVLRLELNIQLSLGEIHLDGYAARAFKSKSIKSNSRLQKVVFSGCVEGDH